MKNVTVACLNRLFNRRQFRRSHIAKSPRTGTGVKEDIYRCHPIA